jgi:hypothetical protein
MTHKEQAKIISKSFSRLLTVLLSASCFLTSYVLLHHGIKEMWLRYPISIFSAYIVFLVMAYYFINTHAIRISAMTPIAPAVSTSQTYTQPSKPYRALKQPGFFREFFSDILGQAVFDSLFSSDVFWYITFPIITILFVFVFGYMLLTEFFLSLSLAYVLKGSLIKNAEQNPRRLFLKSFILVAILILIVGAGMYEVSLHYSHVYSIGQLIEANVGTAD